MNLCSEDVPLLSQFYRGVFGLSSLDYMRVNTDDKAGYSGNVDFVIGGIFASAPIISKSSKND